MSFNSTDTQRAETTTWLTPLPLIQSLGKFDLDPCGFLGHETARKLICLPEDGLKEEWTGRVWLNPPYGKEARLWLNRLKKHGNGIALIFARLETKWIQEFIESGFFAIQGRISFLNDKKEEKENAGSGSILIPFGRKNKGSILSSDLEGQWFQ